MGDAAKVVDSVRLEPALRAAAAQLAKEGTAVFEVIYRALRAYLRSA